MFNLALNTAFNTTLLAAVVGLAWAARPRPARPPRWAARAGLAVLAVGTAANVALGLYRSYTVPRDVLQDIISAKEFAAGRPMEPADMNERMRAALAEEGPRRSLLGWSPELAAREREQLDTMLGEPWVQAHPPFMTLVTVPFVRAFGVLGTQAAFAAIALASLALTLWLIRRELWPGAEGTLMLAAALAVYGWAPVVSVVRLQQPGLILVALLVAAWAWLRRGREVPAGVAVAVAASLKVIPVLMVVPLLALHRRAFAAAAVALAAVALLVLAEVPWRDLVEYRAAAAQVVDDYAHYPANISLLGLYTRVGHVVGLPLAAAKVAWEASGVVLVAVWLWAIVRRRGPAGDRAAVVDLEFAVGMGLMPLLSPVAWDHYGAFLILPLAVLARRLWQAGAGRAAWVGFWAAVLVLSLPEGAYLLAYDAAHAAGLVGLEVGVLEPLRTFVGLAIVIWLLRLRAAPSATADVEATPAAACEPAVGLG